MTAGRATRYGFTSVMVCVLVLVALFATELPARAADEAGGPRQADMVPVLIVDGGLGDARFYVTHWLDGSDLVDGSGDARLFTSQAPMWWGEGGTAPDTYLLTGSENASGEPASGPLGVREISWALEKIAARHPEGKSVIVAQGASGLAVRAYLQDVTETRHSDKANVVGLVMLGTPNAGLQLKQSYPDLDIWEPYAAGAQLTAADLDAGSPFLASLEAAPYPTIVKTAVVEGTAVSLAGVDTDGVAARGDSIIATGVVPTTVDYIPIRATASEAWPLTDTWHPLTKAGGATVDRVDDDQVERLALSRGYPTSPEVQEVVRAFYENWFMDGAPITHISTRLVVDVSGSMAAELAAGTKLDAANAASKAFVGAFESRQQLPGAVPEDIGLLVFNTEVQTPASGGSTPDEVRTALDAMAATGNTDVGKALQAAVESLASSPDAADRVIVFLSDGVSTVGLDKAGILSGPVANADAADIRIEAIALGGVEQADIDFLQQIADATGGSFHQASDTFQLKRDFLRARYASVGTVQLDTALDASQGTSVDLGVLPENTRLVEIGVLTEGAEIDWSITRDGEVVDEETAQTLFSESGYVSIALVDPEPGSYALTLGSGLGQAHVFAVSQVDAFVQHGTLATQDDLASLMLVGIGGAAVLGVLATAIAAFSRRRKRVAGDGRSQSTETDSSSETGK